MDDTIVSFMKLTKKNLKKSLLIIKLKREINQILSEQMKLETQKKALQFKLRGLWVQNAFRL